METFSDKWFICGGWSIDLFLDRQSREHSDIEIDIFREGQPNLMEHFSCGELHYYDNSDGYERKNLVTPVESPIHEIIYTNSNYQLEILLNEKEDGKWSYRRDRSIRRDLELAILHSSEGIPFLSPEIVLLYKSKKPRQIDARDYREVRKYLTTEQQEWMQATFVKLYGMLPDKVFGLT